MSARQAKKARIRARKLDEARWLSEHPEAFGVPGAVTGLRDFGYILGLVVTAPNGLRQGVRSHTLRYGKRHSKMHIARDMGAQLNRWLEAQA